MTADNNPLPHPLHTMTVEWMPSQLKFNFNKKGVVIGGWLASWWWVVVSCTFLHKILNMTWQGVFNINSYSLVYLNTVRGGKPKKKKKHCLSNGEQDYKMFLLDKCRRCENVSEMGISGKPNPFTFLIQNIMKINFSPGMRIKMPPMEILLPEIAI